MKNKIIHVLILAISSLLSGILISKMSFIGKIGITFIYSEYTILKSWWQTALLMFIIQFLIFIVLNFWNAKSIQLFKRVMLPIIFFVVGILGLMYTYYDFTETSHRLMKASFHSGFYLFWVTWFANCIFFMVKKSKKIESVKEEVYTEL